MKSRHGQASRRSGNGVAATASERACGRSCKAMRSANGRDRGGWPVPKLGRDRKSARDDARERDSFGGLGRDQDYDWIKYLGEGRTASPAGPAVAPPVEPEARRPARPARPPAEPVRPSAEPARPSSPPSRL